ncbi:hypothetical protein SS50377_23554 [Spironucleus salmonicida]|uniref:Uncharacterized protein n=1 Tax=Spironucleus salmonicida TaxID=348837 RepID=V6LXU8_9EUKA|nr:hypothetical protein SS50377_23554 [Spironucleus salmonicida]|eukprot:EST48536.1 Hypothetical protein SS50377_11147 [Spironucleus salmonicida]
MDQTIIDLEKALNFTNQPLQMSVNQTLQLLNQVNDQFTQLSTIASPLLKSPQSVHFDPLLKLLANVESQFQEIEKFEQIADLLETTLVNLEDIQFSRKPKGLKKLLKQNLSQSDEEIKLDISQKCTLDAVKQLKEIGCYKEDVTGQEVVFGMQRKRAQEGQIVKENVIEAKQEVVVVKRGLVINAEDEESD